MKLVLLFCFIFGVSTQSYAKILIMTLAQVKNHVITSREVEIHKILKQSLGGPQDYFKEDTLVEQVIKEWLLYDEALTFYNTKISTQAISEKKASVLKQVGSMDEWKRLSVTQSELTDKIRRHLEAQRLFTFKKKASVLPVSLSEVETEYSQNRIRYGNMSFEEAKAQIRKNKVKENLQKRLTQWFQVLEKKYKVQRFSEYGA